MQGRFVSLLTMHRCRNKSVILKCMCCHGCQPLRASTAVLGIELGGHRTYSCCKYILVVCLFLVSLNAAFFFFFYQNNKELLSMVDGEGKIAVMHLQSYNLTGAQSVYGAQW